VGLSANDVKALLSPKVSDSKAPLQDGPLRWYDHEMRCASKGCSSPTYCKVEGVPYCMMHSLRKLNELVVQVTKLRERDWQPQTS
jgi:hypothetical protein